MAGVVYRIRDWDELFENNRTRELKRLTFVCVPNKHDGEGYLTLVDHPDGAAHYGAWHAILQVASKCRPRGTLVRDSGRPHTAESIARKTTFPVGVIGAALERLVTEAIDWVEVLDIETLTPIPQEGAGFSQEGALKGREGKGKKQKAAAPRFIPPTLEEVKAHCLERKYGISPEDFMNFYASNGWKVGGKASMKDWKAATANWDSRRKKDARESGETPEMV